MIASANSYGPSSKIWTRPWRFLVPVTVCAVLLTASVAFASSEGQAGGAAQTSAPNQETHGDRGIQPNLEYPILAIGAPAPDFDPARSRWQEP